MMKKRALFTFISTITLILNTTLCIASERRFEIDSKLRSRLEEMEKKHLILSSSSRDGDVFIVDASGVFSGDLESILQKAAQYDRFVQMEMPHLDISTVVERKSNELLYVFSKMSYLMLKSSQYMEVRVSPGVGVDWEMVPKRPHWSFDVSSSFKRTDGSFYAEKLPSGKIYVRYFMLCDLNVPLTGLLGGLIESSLRSGAADVIKILAKEAGFQQ